MQMATSMETESGEMIVKRVSVPVGLEELMEGLSKEVMQKKPKDIYVFASEYFAKLLDSRQKRGLTGMNVKRAQSVSRQQFSLNNSVQHYKKSKSVETAKELAKQSKLPSGTPLGETFSAKKIQIGNKARNFIEKRKVERNTQERNKEDVKDNEKISKTTQKRERSLSTNRSKVASSKLSSRQQSSSKVSKKNDNKENEVKVKKENAVKQASQEITKTDKNVDKISKEKAEEETLMNSTESDKGFDETDNTKQDVKSETTSKEEIVDIKAQDNKLEYSLKETQFVTNDQPSTVETQYKIEEKNLESKDSKISKEESQKETETGKSDDQGKVNVDKESVSVAGEKPKKEDIKKVSGNQSIDVNEENQKIKDNLHVSKLELQEGDISRILKVDSGTNNETSKKIKEETEANQDSDSKEINDQIKINKSETVKPKEVGKPEAEKVEHKEEKDLLTNIQDTKSEITVESKEMEKTKESNISITNKIETAHVINEERNRKTGVPKEAELVSGTEDKNTKNATPNTKKTDESGEGKTELQNEDLLVGEDSNSEKHIPDNKNPKEQIKIEETENTSKDRKEETNKTKSTSEVDEVDEEKKEKESKDQVLQVQKEIKNENTKDGASRLEETRKSETKKFEDSGEGKDNKKSETGENKETGQKDKLPISNTASNLTGGKKNKEEQKQIINNKDKNTIDETIKQKESAQNADANHKEIKEERKRNLAPEANEEKKEKDSKDQNFKEHKEIKDEITKDGALKVNGSSKSETQKHEDSEAGRDNKKSEAGENKEADKTDKLNAERKGETKINLASETNEGKKEKNSEEQVLKEYKKTKDECTKEGALKAKENTKSEIQKFEDSSVGKDKKSRIGENTETDKMDKLSTTKTTSEVTEEKKNKENESVLVEQERIINDKDKNTTKETIKQKTFSENADAKQIKSTVQENPEGPIEKPTPEVKTTIEDGIKAQEKVENKETEQKGENKEGKDSLLLDAVITEDSKKKESKDEALLIKNEESAKSIQTKAEESAEVEKSVDKHEAKPKEKYSKQTTSQDNSKSVETTKSAQIEKAEINKTVTNEEMKKPKSEEEVQEKSEDTKKDADNIDQEDKNKSVKIKNTNQMDSSLDFDDLDKMQDLDIIGKDTKTIYSATSQKNPDLPSEVIHQVQNKSDILSVESSNEMKQSAEKESLNAEDSHEKDENLTSDAKKIEEKSSEVDTTTEKDNGKAVKKEEESSKKFKQSPEKESLNYNKAPENLKSRKVAEDSFKKDENLASDGAKKVEEKSTNSEVDTKTTTEEDKGKAVKTEEPKVPEGERSKTKIIQAVAPQMADIKKQPKKAKSLTEDVVPVKSIQKTYRAKSMEHPPKVSDSQKKQEENPRTRTKRATSVENYSKKSEKIRTVKSFDASKKDPEKAEITKFPLNPSGQEIKASQAPKLSTMSTLNAAIKIQSLWRGTLARKKAKILRKTIISDTCTTKINSDKFINELKISDENSSDEINDHNKDKSDRTSPPDEHLKIAEAVLKIQAIWRGFKVRQRKKRGEFTAEKSQEKMKEQHSAATKIQANWKGYKAREHLKTFNKTEDRIYKAAATIQAGFRGFIARKNKPTPLKSIKEETISDEDMIAALASLQQIPKLESFESNPPIEKVKYNSLEDGQTELEKDIKEAVRIISENNNSEELEDRNLTEGKSQKENQLNVLNDDSINTSRKYDSKNIEQIKNKVEDVTELLSSKINIGNESSDEIGNKSPKKIADEERNKSAESSTSFDSAETVIFNEKIDTKDKLEASGNPQVDSINPGKGDSTKHLEESFEKASKNEPKHSKSEECIAIRKEPIAHSKSEEQTIRKEESFENLNVQDKKLDLVPKKEDQTESSSGKVEEIAANLKDKNQKLSNLEKDDDQKGRDDSSNLEAQVDSIFGKEEEACDGTKNLDEFSVKDSKIEPKRDKQDKRLEPVAKKEEKSETSSVKIEEIADNLLDKDQKLSNLENVNAQKEEASGEITPINLEVSPESQKSTKELEDKNQVDLEKLNKQALDTEIETRDQNLKHLIKSKSDDELKKDGKSVESNKNFRKSLTQNDLLESEKKIPPSSPKEQSEEYYNLNNRINKELLQKEIGSKSGISSNAFNADRIEDEPFEEIKNKKIEEEIPKDNKESLKETASSSTQKVELKSDSSEELEASQEKQKAKEKTLGNPNASNTVEEIHSKETVLSALPPKIDNLQNIVKETSETTDLAKLQEDGRSQKDPSSEELLAKDSDVGTSTEKPKNAESNKKLEDNQENLQEPIQTNTEMLQESSAHKNRGDQKLNKIVREPLPQEEIQTTANNSIGQSNKKNEEDILSSNSNIPEKIEETDVDGKSSGIANNLLLQGQKDVQEKSRHGKPETIKSDKDEKPEEKSSTIEIKNSTTPLSKDNSNMKEPLQKEISSLKTEGLPQTISGENFNKLNKESLRHEIETRVSIAKSTLVNNLHQKNPDDTETKKPMDSTESHVLSNADNNQLNKEELEKELKIHYNVDENWIKSDGIPLHINKATDTAEEAEEPEETPAVNLVHSGEFHDAITATLSMDSSTQCDPPEEHQSLMHSGELHDHVMPALIEVEEETPAGAGGHLTSLGGAQASIKDASACGPRPGKSQTSTTTVGSMEMEKRNNASSNLQNKTKNMEAEAATKIQAGFRGYQVRKQLKNKIGAPGDISNQRRSARRKSSGRVTESGRITQTKTKNPSDIEEKSAVKIQAGVRGFLVRRRQKKEKKVGE